MCAPSLRPLACWGNSTICGCVMSNTENGHEMLHDTRMRMCNLLQRIVFTLQVMRACRCAGHALAFEDYNKTHWEGKQCMRLGRQGLWSKSGPDWCGVSCKVGDHDCMDCWCRTWRLPCNQLSAAIDRSQLQVLLYLVESEWRILHCITNLFMFKHSIHNALCSSCHFHYPHHSHTYIPSLSVLSWLLTQGE